MHREDIPPFLQMRFLHSKRLLHQTYDLEFFSLQMIHASRALLHAVVSLAEVFQRFEPRFKAVGRNEHLDKYSEDFLLVASLLAEKLDRSTLILPYSYGSVTEIPIDFSTTCE
jgi:hypothetical protein